MTAKVRSRAAASASAQQLRAVKQQLKDLQEKRLSALRLYQDEKTLRQRETSRAEKLATQLSNLQNEQSHVAKPPPQPFKTPESPQLPPIGMLRTDHFSAKVLSTTRAPSSPLISLTWHCMAMADLIPPSPEVFAVLQPTSLSSQNPASPNATALNDSFVSENKRSPPDCIATYANRNHSVANVDQVRSLSEQLAAVPSHPTTATPDPAFTIADLETKLCLSQTTCSELLATIQKQQETIRRLSSSR